jgi:phospho-N-acetylmuramoyl-pentapeptide-transferase
LWFLDDYIKVFKKIRTVLSGKFKVLGQVGLGIIGRVLYLYFNDGVTIKQHYLLDEQITQADGRKAVYGLINQQKLRYLFF